MKRVRILILITLIFAFGITFGGILNSQNPVSTQGMAFAAEPDDDDEPIDDDMPPGKKPAKEGKLPPGLKWFLPTNPEVKKMHLEAMTLAEKFTAIVAERSQLQKDFAALEAREAQLKHLRLKYRLRYYRMRDEVTAKFAQDKKIQKLLNEENRTLDRIDDLIAQEEKIDCLHTIFERKHRAMEENHWKMIDEKHPLIAEYLSDIPYKGHENEYKMLYGEMINDYKKIIAENREILTKSKEILREKKKRMVILEKIANELKSLTVEIAPVFDSIGN